MRVAVFSTKSYDKEHFNQANSQYGYELEFFDVRLEAKTARLAHGFPVVCLFVNDDADREVLTELAANGTKVIALRCAGYNNVDLAAAKELGLKVVRVPAYSPEAVAEHAVGLMMTLNRRIHKAYQRTRDANFSLEGLVGFNMHGRTAGIIGTGKIGIATLRILKGFGMRLLVSDPYPNQAAIDLGAEYVDIDTLLRHFDDLTQAHEAVREARDQIAALDPLVAHCDAHDRLGQRIAVDTLAREALPIQLIGLTVLVAGSLLGWRSMARGRASGGKW